MIRFNDLPAPYRANVEKDPPFGGHPGDPLPLSKSEIDDIVAFLRTLTDGYRRSNSRASIEPTCHLVGLSIVIIANYKSGSM